MPWLGIAAIVILFDQITKITILKTFRYAQEMVITSYFNLVLAYNKGAAFSFLSDQGGWQRYFFTGIALAAAIYIIYLLKKHAGQRMFCWALALILGGALGGAIDRLMYGHVVDFMIFTGRAGAISPLSISPTAPSASARPCSSSMNCATS